MSRKSKRGKEARQEHAAEPGLGTTVQAVVKSAQLELPSVKAALAKWTDLPEWHGQLGGLVDNGGASVFVGTDNLAEWQSLAIIVFPEATGADLPWFLHFQNVGSAKLKVAMINSALDSIKAAGYNGYRAVNRTGKPDKVWLRAFKRGGKPEFEGTIWRFDIG